MTTGRLSNGPVEGVNRKIKQIKEPRMVTRTGKTLFIEFKLSSKSKSKKRTQFVNELDSKYNFINTG
ncbi:Mobile element protein [Lactiplantibacillus plantarum]|nr:Mobile element protein [Lactiplantibacillus plantarum]KZV01094.1 Mobile element protein [Lactiplantibacillus plantarum]